VHEAAGITLKDCFSHLHWLKNLRVFVTGYLRSSGRRKKTMKRIHTRVETHLWNKNRTENADSNLELH
jgi:hypothetical protein